MSDDSRYLDDFFPQSLSGCIPSQYERWKGSESESAKFKLKMEEALGIEPGTLKEDTPVLHAIYLLGIESGHRHGDYRVNMSLRHMLTSTIEGMIEHYAKHQDAKLDYHFRDSLEHLVYHKVNEHIPDEEE